MDAAQETDTALFEIARDGLVCAKHELFNQAMRDIPLAARNVRHAAVGIEFDHRLGKIEIDGAKLASPGDEDLREIAHGEEIGLEERFVEPLGWLDPYLTGTGFRVAPLVALVEPTLTLTINDREVDEVFETPFAFLMDPANHRLEEREWQGRRREFYAMPHEGRYIWGATAGILRNLYEKLFS